MSVVLGAFFWGTVGLCATEGGVIISCAESETCPGKCLGLLDASEVMVQRFVEETTSADHPPSFGDAFWLCDRVFGLWFQLTWGCTAIQCGRQCINWRRDGHGGKYWRE